MTHHPEERSPVSDEPEVGPAPLSTSEISELFQLLAFTREQAEEARSLLAAAAVQVEERGNRVEQLLVELDGMTGALTLLQNQFDTAESARESATAQVTALQEDLISALQRTQQAEITARDVAIERDELRQELLDLRKSTSWRVTAPVRAVTGRVARPRQG